MKSAAAYIGFIGLVYSVCTYIAATNSLFNGICAGATGIAIVACCGAIARKAVED